MNLHMKRCSDSGGFPAASVATQLAIAAKNTAMPQRNDPDEMGDREQEPEEDREAAPLEVVLDDKLDRMLVHAWNL